MRKTANPGPPYAASICRSWTGSTFAKQTFGRGNGQRSSAVMIATGGSEGYMGQALMPGAHGPIRRHSTSDPVKDCVIAARKGKL